MIALGLLAVISVPLYVAFVDLVEQEQIMKSISPGQLRLADRVVRYASSRFATASRRWFVSC